MNHCGPCFEAIKTKTKIIYNPTEVNRFGNMNNIEFDFLSKDNDDADIVFFNSLLNEDLLLRNLPTYGNLMERRSRLLPFVKFEHRLTGIQDAILCTAEGKDAALMLIKQAIPCIMHLENRVGEKLITILLSIGGKRFQCESRVVSLDHYVERMHTIVSTQVLGTRLRPKQWKFPTSDDRKEVSTNISILCNISFIFMPHVKHFYPFIR